MTPRLFSLTVKGRLKGIETERRERRWLVWHQAYLPNAKRPPRLTEFVGGERERPRMTTDQMKAVSQHWHAALNRKPKR